MRLKQLLLLGLTVFTINNCQYQYNQMHEWYHLHDSKIPAEIKNIPDKDDAGDSIMNWLCDKYNFTYECYANGFNPAEETLRTRRGNCANISLLALALNYSITNRKSKGDLVYCRNAGGLHYTARMNKKIEDDIIEIYEVIPFDKIGDFIYCRQ